MNSSLASGVITGADAFLDALARNVTYAYQPIVNVHTGEAYGFEALLRGHEQLGFSAIPMLFASMADVDTAAEAEMLLLDRAIGDYMRFARDAAARLFFNANNRVLNAHLEHRPHMRSILERHQLPTARFCLELSEAETLNVSRSQQFFSGWTERPLIALDDFGTGYSGLRLLAESRPDIVKIDRFFVAGIDGSQEKRLFLEQIVGLAHSIGLSVVAEGIETELEFQICREIGCDYVQGFFIARPSSDPAQHHNHYEIVQKLNRRNRRDRAETRNELRAELDPVAPLSVDAPMIAILEAFRDDRKRSFFPVANARNEPVGIVHEERLKALIYSQFGRDLLTNRVRPHRVTEYVTPCLVFEVSTEIDRVLAAIAQRPNDHAVLIVEDGAYIGLLDTRGIIRTMHERMLTMARDQNPLTKLPGNIMVANYMVDALDSDVRPQLFVHFDFDYFKPFNDRFGFRQGDRAITMFADLMRGRLAAENVFLGHIGGDDFFLGAQAEAVEPVLAALPEFIAKFASDMASFYDADARFLGVIEGTDRNGATQIVPLLSVSCGCAIVRESSGAVNLDELSAVLADLKKRAKRSPAKVVIEEFRR
ncbi:MAG TPA: GGDEF domain-containing protein [Candidatus Lustribacter sp.]|nr:GGDEF domain-containing protein [Candidatus Lustribacter sp.]